LNLSYEEARAHTLGRIRLSKNLSMKSSADKGLIDLGFKWFQTFKPVYESNSFQSFQTFKTFQSFKNRTLIKC